ncbi:MAG TPA: DUF3574 domain-containing protein [Stellaceae bacterium]|nr:DUF3574 domain-containing protein [Stellaceae bacterium]
MIIRRSLVAAGRRVRPKALAAVPPLLALLVAGCSTSPGGRQPAECAAGHGQSMVEAKLYFGRDRDGEEAPKPGGNTPIPDTDWREFLQSVVTVRFPDGFTVIDSYGQWRNPQTGVVTRQRSAVLDIVAPDGPETLKGIDEIVAEWKRRTHHLSVGVVLAPVCASF